MNATATINQRTNCWATARACCWAAAGALALAGCGSSPLTQAQLVPKVDGACASYHAELRRLPFPRDFSTNTTAAAAYLDKLNGPVHSQYDNINALEAKGAVKHDFDRFLRATKYQLGLFTDADAKAHAHSQAYLADLQHVASYTRRILAPLERHLGFTSCLS